MTPRPLVAYYRVSTRQQKRSGLGLFAQQDAVRRHIEANPGNLISEWTPRMRAMEQKLTLPIALLRDNQGENGATIWMRMPPRGCRREGVARP